MSIIEGIVEYVRACPLLKDGKMRVDHLSPKPVEYAVETLPAVPVVQTYINGDTIRQYIFAISSREFYSVEKLQNMKNLGFYEELEAWFVEQRAKENFPDIGYPVTDIELMSYGYLFSVDAKTARYQLQARVEYFKEG